MEIPDPAPEIVITLPKRGKIRITTVEEADALIAQACKAKVMILAARAAIGPADPGVPAHEETAQPLPPPCAQHAPDNSPGECARLDGHRPPHRNLAGYEWGEEEGEDISVGSLVVDVHDDSPSPTVGLVFAQAGEDAVEVAWGAQRSRANPLTHREPVAALRRATDKAPDVASGIDPFAIPPNRIGGAR